jgi:hypothetical protein
MPAQRPAGALSRAVMGALREWRRLEKIQASDAGGASHPLTNSRHHDGRGLIVGCGKCGLYFLSVQTAGSLTFSNFRSH